MVRQALADGGYLSRGAPAPGLRDPEALVGEGDPEDCPGAVGSVLRWSPCSLTSRWRRPDAVRRAAWYEKSYPTFSDALALVRKELWAQEDDFLRVACSRPTR